MSLIKQASVAKSISFFKQNLFSKYNLTDYYDTNSPALFFGAKENSDLINKHNSYKLILPATPTDYPNLTNYDKVIFICSDDFILPENVIRKNLTPEIKNYSIFEPSKLGDKIYWYSGFKNGWTFGSDIIKTIQKRIKFEIITTNHSNLKDYHDIDYLKSNFYDKCFLNLNLSNGHGLATTIELGLMGRKTILKKPTIISIQRISFPNFIYYNSVDDIINIINEESKKIGTIQPKIDAHNVGNEWLDLDFWL